MRIATAALIAALIATACGQPAATGGAATSAGAVTVTMGDQKIDLSQASVAPGKVTFSVKNAGTVVHSLVVLKTDTPHDKIPADPKDASKVQETGSIAATGQIAVGETRSFSRDLAAGNYVLICNEPAHYIIGMHIAFTVK